jgi:uncharacterized protein YecA (UPF0149 family)
MSEGRRKKPFKLPVIEITQQAFDKLPEVKTIEEGTKTKKSFKMELKNGGWIGCDTKTAFVIRIKPEPFNSSKRNLRVTKPIVRKGPKFNVNGLCPCGSDKKYKRCCR